MFMKFNFMSVSEELGPLRFYIGAVHIFSVTVPFGNVTNAIKFAILFHTNFAWYQNMLVFVSRPGVGVTNVK